MKVNSRHKIRKISLLLKAAIGPTSSLVEFLFFGEVNNPLTRYVSCNSFAVFNKLTVCCYSFVPSLIN